MLFSEQYISPAKFSDDKRLEISRLIFLVGKVPYTHHCAFLNFYKNISSYKTNVSLFFNTQGRVYWFVGSCSFCCRVFIHKVQNFHKRRFKSTDLVKYKLLLYSEIKAIVQLRPLNGTFQD